MAKVSEMFPSRFLGKEDLPAPKRVTIARIGMESIKGENGEQNKNVLYFAGNSKAMILNKGNAMILAALFGDDNTAWVGKSVEVYVDPTVMFGGKMVGGVRIRQTTQGATVWTWPQAVKEAANVGITEDALKIELKKAGLNGYDAKRDTAAVQKMIDDISGAGHGLDDTTEVPIGEIPF